MDAYFWRPREIESNTSLLLRVHDDSLDPPRSTLRPSFRDEVLLENLLTSSQLPVPLESSEDSVENKRRRPLLRYNRAAARRRRLPKPKNQPQVLSSETIYQGKVFAIRRDNVVEPQGVQATREIVTHPGSVVVLPVFADGRILLIRQYRYVAGQFLWELVAGRRDEGENFVQGALRELEEETGYRAEKLTQIMDVFPSPGFLAENMVIFVAEGLTKGKARPEEDEKITPRIVTLREAEDWISTGKIRDAKTVAGILFYSTFLAGRGGKRSTAAKRVPKSSARKPRSRK